MNAPATELTQCPGRLQHERSRVEVLIRAAEHRALMRSPGRHAGAIESDARAQRRRPLRPRPVAAHEHRQRIAAAHVR